MRNRLTFVNVKGTKYQSNVKIKIIYRISTLTQSDSLHLKKSGKSKAHLTFAIGCHRHVTLTYTVPCRFRYFTIII